MPAGRKSPRVRSSPFDSKEALFKALARGSKITGARLEAIQAFIAQYEGNAADLLRLVIANIGEFARTSDRIILPRLMLAEAGNFPELAKFWRHELLEQGLGIAPVDHPARD